MAEPDPIGSRGRNVGVPEVGDLVWITGNGITLPYQPCIVLGAEKHRYSDETFEWVMKISTGDQILYLMQSSCFVVEE